MTTIPNTSFLHNPVTMMVMMVIMMVMMVIMMTMIVIMMVMMAIMMVMRVIIKILYVAGVIFLFSVNLQDTFLKSVPRQRD